MTTAFQSDAFQNNAFQIDTQPTGCFVQMDAFQNNAFQPCPTPTPTAAAVRPKARPPFDVWYEHEFVQMWMETDDL